MPEIVTSARAGVAVFDPSAYRRPKTKPSNVMIEVVDISKPQPTPKHKAPQTVQTKAEESPFRPLVTLRQINDIYVDRSYLGKVCAAIDGWVCAVDRGKFTKGETVVFAEVDSFLPANDKRFAELEPHKKLQGELGHRVQTVTYGKNKHSKGLVSQGHVFKLRDFPEINEEVQRLKQALAWMKDPKQVDKLVAVFFECHCFAKKLGVKKWEEAKAGVHTKLGPFPKDLINKPDPKRLQEGPNLFTKPKYNRLEYQESIKMDGASMTVYFVNKAFSKFKDLNPLPKDDKDIGPNTVHENGRFGVCSKNCDLNELGPHIDQSHYWVAALELDLPQKLANLGQSIAIQGELCGDKVNGNREGLPVGKREFYVFAIYNLVTRRYLNPKETVKRAKSLGLKHVPVRGYSTIPKIVQSKEELQARADGLPGEGLVFKCHDQGRSLWFKVLSNEYLEKHDL